KEQVTTLIMDNNEILEKLDDILKHTKTLGSKEDKSLDVFALEPIAREVSAIKARLSTFMTNAQESLSGSIKKIQEEKTNIHETVKEALAMLDTYTKQSDEDYQAHCEKMEEIFQGNTQLS